MQDLPFGGVGPSGMGNYHGYDGFAIFARDMDMAINNPVWSLTKTPWK